MRKIACLVIAVFLFAPAAWACNYTFDVAWISPVAVDAARSAGDTLGFDNWYVWKYRIDVISSSSRGKALSNWVLELPNCYLSSPQLFNEIEASAGWGGGDKVRVYDPEIVDPDPNHALSGLKWEFKNVCGSDELDRIGEYDYFWFSAPTDIDIETNWSIKAGSGILASGTTRGPRCPPQEVIPEPMSLVLFGAGLAALSYRKRKLSNQ